MSRDALPRAYLRIDPNVDQVYPELRNTFVGLLCSAHRQPARGRYRDRRLVEQLHSRAFVSRCFDRGDLVSLDDGRVYLDGWDEWQEGDLTVADRMRRMRDRRKTKRDGRVTPLASPEPELVTTDAEEINGVSDSVSPQPPTRGGRRSDKTNPRSIAAENTRIAAEAEAERKWMRNQRLIALRDGRITPDQRDEMDERNAPLEEIPTERGAAYKVPA